MAENRNIYPFNKQENPDEADIPAEQDPLRGLRETVRETARLRSVTFEPGALEAKTEEELDRILERLMEQPVTVLEDRIPAAQPTLLVYAGPAALRPSGWMRMPDGTRNPLLAQMSGVYAGPQPGAPAGLAEQAEPTENEAAENRCRFCGAPLTGRPKFCVECGAKQEYDA